MTLSELDSPIGKQALRHQSLSAQCRNRRGIRTPRGVGEWKAGSVAQLLARLARLLNRPGFRQKLSDAEDAAEVLALVRDTEQSTRPPPE